MLFRSDTIYTAGTPSGTSGDYIDDELPVYQGETTQTLQDSQMTVKQISQARETQSYPQQGIRSCNAIVETNGVKYVTDYSIILNDKGFFVQVENAQPAQRF